MTSPNPLMAAHDRRMAFWRFIAKAGEVLLVAFLLIALALVAGLGTGAVR